MYKLCVESEFSAAHRLPEYPGNCERVHGHNWKVQVTIKSNKLDDLGMVIDLMELKKYVDDCLLQFDHRLLNDVPPFDRTSPTSENLARFIFDWLKKNLPAKAPVEKVQIYETDQLSVSYSEE
jgi:6-pyruvoyltetrahydropterin/6-carboxytetrahydropterin synthase